jgi:RNA polymerase sigma factor (sigma-70 family)
MPDTILNTGNRYDIHNTTHDIASMRDVNITMSHAALLADMEQLFTEARPRLLRLARLNGMTPDVADDVVQETMMEAWRHLDNLRNPQRFDAWLDGICRNVCRRQVRNLAITIARHEPLPLLPPDTGDDSETETFVDIPDPFVADPEEVLSKQDLAVLLDRAMSHLPGDTRSLLEMCYLAELPQREAAMQLGLTIGALELRLHRARKQLRKVLNGALRSDSESFGLKLDPVLAEGWQEIRMWCWLCGKHRLLGVFETQPDGHVEMRMRCPECSKRYDIDLTGSVGMVSMEGLRSFRPAFKRIMQVMSERAYLPLTKNTCWLCYRPTKVRIFHSSEADFLLPPDRYWIETNCPNCGKNESDIATILITHPIVQRFFTQHERFVSEPYKLIEHKGTSVISARLTDITNATQLTILLHAQTLNIIAVFSES